MLDLMLVILELLGHPAEPRLANRRYKPPDSDALPQAPQVVAHAKEVSHPDS